MKTSKVKTSIGLLEYIRRTADPKLKFEWFEDQETQMTHKIPPREWPVYAGPESKEQSKCAACGGWEANDVYCTGGESYIDKASFIARTCNGCGMVRYERPLDFDFDAWADIWAIETTIERWQAKLLEARKALDEKQATASEVE